MCSSIINFFAIFLVYIHILFRYLLIIQDYICIVAKLHSIYLDVFIYMFIYFQWTFKHKTILFSSYLLRVK